MSGWLLLCSKVHVFTDNRKSKFRKMCFIFWKSKSKLDISYDNSNDVCMRFLAKSVQVDPTKGWNPNVPLFAKIGPDASDRWRTEQNGKSEEIAGNNNVHLHTYLFRQISHFRVRVRKFAYGSSNTLISTGTIQPSRAAYFFPCVRCTTSVRLLCMRTFEVGYSSVGLHSSETVPNLSQKSTEILFVYTCVRWAVFLVCEGSVLLYPHML